MDPELTPAEHHAKERSHFVARGIGRQLESSACLELDRNVFFGPSPTSCPRVLVSSCPLPFVQRSPATHVLLTVVLLFCSFAFLLFCFFAFAFAFAFACLGDLLKACLEISNMTSSRAIFDSPEPCNNNPETTTRLLQARAGIRRL